MLTIFRNMLRSKLAIILIGLLILSLSVWGLSDIFSPKLGNSLVKIGSRTVEASDVNRIADSQLDRINENGTTYTRQDLADAGQLNGIVGALANREIVAAYFEKLELSASQEAIRDQIRQNPNFRSEINGGFDLALYQRFLSNRRMSENAFIQSMADDLTIVSMNDGLYGALKAPKALTDLISVSEAEARRVAYMIITPDKLSETVPAPSDEEIQTFYNEQQAALTQPERRGFSVIAITPQDFIHQVNVTEEELRNDYEAQIRRFSSAPSRTFQTMITPSESDARGALGRLQGGDEMAAVTSRFNASLLPVETSLQGNVPSPVLAAAIFSAPIGLWTGPVSLPDGRWALVNVSTETNGDPIPFDQVETTIREEMIQLKAERMYSSSLDDIDDAVGSGATLEELADIIGSPIYTYPPVDKAGRTEDGSTLSYLTQIDGAIGYGFQLFPDETSFRQDAGETQFIIHLNEVIAPLVSPLDEIKDELSQLIQARKTQVALTDFGNSIVSRISDGGAFLTTEAEALGVEVTRPPEALRKDSAQSSGFSREALIRVFASDLDKPFIVPLKNGLFVGVVEAIEIPQGQALDALRASADVEVTASLQSDIEQGLLSLAQQNIEYQMNPVAIDAYIKDNQSPQ